MKSYQIEEFFLYLFVCFLRHYDVQKIHVRIGSVQGRNVPVIVLVLQVLIKQVLEPVELVSFNFVKVDVIVIFIMLIVLFI